MCAHKIVAVSLTFLVCFINHADAGQAKEVTCIGKVLDAQGRPIAGAKVTAYEMHSDGIAGNILLRPAGEITTAKDGAFVFTTPPKPKRGVFFECIIVAVKPDLALAWTDWTMREEAKSNIQLGAPEKLGGVIVDEVGKPIAGAEVRANLSRTVKTTDGEEKKQWLPGIDPLEELGTKTDSQGRFHFDNLPSDVDVDLLMKAEGRATTYTYELEPGEPAFKSGQIDIKVTLPVEARIEGRIVDSDTSKGIPGVRFAVVATSSGLFYYRFVHTTNDNGTFSVAGLQTDRYLLRGTGLPHTYVNVNSGQTAKVTVRANKPYYVRILFEDGSPVVLESEPWPGARTKISFKEEGRSSRSVVNIDDEGFSKVYLSHEQYQKARIGKAWFEVTVPYTTERAYYEENVFLYDLLATDKAKAGVARIPKLGIEPDSLAGKPLPDLKEFGIDLLKERTQKKRVLVCFWDMNQRPSRNCLRQLSKRAEELKTNGVLVAAVHAWKVDKNTPNEWAKKNNIPFPIGMITADIERIRFAWGVRSLPWLILTDDSHVVISEGFGLNELEDKLKETNNVRQ